MGADLWYHEGPWFPEPIDSLRALQERFFLDNYNLSEVLSEALANARDAATYSSEEGDPHKLVEFYEEQIRSLEALSGQPMPEDVPSQIEILRQVYRSGGDEISNVLDVRDVTQVRGIDAAYLLAPVEIVHFTGAERPTVSEAHEAVGPINGVLGRGECVCFAAYDDDRMTPVCWFFVGNTVD